MGKAAWYPDDRTRLNKRLAAEDRFDAYSAIRDGYKVKGVTDKVAWQVAGLQMPPLNGDPLEFTPDHVALDLFEQMGPLDTPNPPAAERVRSNFTRYPEGGTEETQDKLMPPEKRWATAEEFVLKVPADKRAGALEELAWALACYMTPWKDIDPALCPSHGAVGLLRHIKLSPTNYADILKTAWVKTIPDKKQLEASQRFADTGQKQLGMLDAFDEEILGDSEVTDADAA